MEGKNKKIKRGGLDTIIAYIVVMLPLLYVLVYMIATIYHFSVQMYMNQVVKEAAVMISTYGDVTENHSNYIKEKLNGIIDNDTVTIDYYVRPFNEDTGVVGNLTGPYTDRTVRVEKADIIGIYVQSNKPSILGSVASFSIFGNSSNESDLYYSSYREEIIRNEHP